MFATLGKQTLVYGISGAALQVVGVITVPVFTRAFDPADYGVIEIATVGLAALLVVADLGLTAGSQRSYFDHHESAHRERQLVLTTAISFSMATSLLVAAVLIVARKPIASWIFHDPDQAAIVVIVATSLPLALLANLFREVMRLKFRAWQYVVSSVVAALAAGAYGVVAVVFFDAGVEAVLLGLLIGNALAALFGGLAVRRDLGLGFHGPELRKMLVFGLPLIPAAVALWGLAFLDRLMLSRLGNLSDVGQYAVASRFATVLMLVVVAFSNAFSPFTMSLWSEDRELEKSVRGRTFTYVTIALTGLALVLALYAREVALVVAPGYDSAFRAVGLLSLGAAVFGMSAVVGVGISLARRTKYFAIFTVAVVALNFVLNLIFIPTWGLYGAAAATAISYAALTVLYYVQAQRVYRTPYEPRKVVLALALSCVFLPIGLLAIEPIWLDLVVKTGALGIYAAALLVSGVFDREELAELRMIAARARKFTQPSAQGS